MISNRDFISRNIFKMFYFYWFIFERFRFAFVVMFEKVMKNFIFSSWYKIITFQTFMA